ncbi:MAG: transglutaminase-like domain-containing protein [Bacteroidota bacterium]
METFESVAKELVLNKNSDSLKILAIYEWVTSNIVYDYRAFKSGEPYRFQSPELVFAKRKTTCSGYSNLMVAMLDKVGIPAFEVEGYTKDITLGFDTSIYNADHSWMAFKADGKWFVCDPTWDAGRVQIVGVAEVQKTWFQRLMIKIKAWKFWKLFWSKERKRAALNPDKSKKVSIKKPIPYRVAYVSNARKDYIFKKPEAFAKDHLSSIAHWQMNNAPVVLSEFLDSVYLMSDTIIKKEGDFNYDGLNEEYFSLDNQKRLLWKADSLQKFNIDNFGDKGNHLFSYLLFESNKKGKNIETRDYLFQVCDSVENNIKIALTGIKNYNTAKKKYMLYFFKRENISDKNKQKSLSYMQNLMIRVESVFTKGILKYETKSVKQLQLMGNSNSSYKSNEFKIDTLKIVDSIFWKTRFDDFKHQIDSIKKLQTFAKTIGDSLMKRIFFTFNKTIDLYEASFIDIYNTSLIYEDRIHQNDSMLESSFKYINKTFKDSILTYFNSSNSLGLINKVEQQLSELTKYSAYTKTKQNEKIIHYFEHELYWLFENEFAILSDRTADAKAIQKTVKTVLVPFVPAFKGALGSLSSLKVNRQKYLNDYLKIKVNRVVKLYSYDLQGVKKIRGALKLIKK